MSRMATRTMLPAKPTFGWHEWLMKSMTGSYSASSTATRWKSSANLHLGVAQPLRQGPQRRRVDDMAALDRDDLVCGNGNPGDQPASLDGARPALMNLRRDVTGDDHDRTFHRICLPTAGQLGCCRDHRPVP